MSGREALKGRAPGKAAAQRAPREGGDGAARGAADRCATLFGGSALFLVLGEGRLAAQPSRTLGLWLRLLQARRGQVRSVLCSVCSVSLACPALSAIAVVTVPTAGCALTVPAPGPPGGPGRMRGGPTVGGGSLQAFLLCLE